MAAPQNKVYPASKLGSAPSAVNKRVHSSAPIRNHTEEYASPKIAVSEFETLPFFFHETY